jgi:hypothetical protein
MDEPVNPKQQTSSFGSLRAALRDSRTVEWSEFAGTRALRCLPAIITPLILGSYLHKPLPALLAAAAAMSVGFGSFQRLYHSRITPMLAASLCLTASALVGTSVRPWDIAVILAVAIWGFLRGLSASIGPGAVYIATQSIVFLLLSTALAIPTKDAVILIAFVFGSALLQTAVITACRLVFRTPFGNGVSGLPSARLSPLRAARLAVHTVRRTATRKKAEFWSAVRIGTTIGLSALLSRLSHDHHSYWMPMTTAIILQQDMHQTYIRAFSRVGGTLLGVSIATAIAAVVRPSHIEIIALVVAFAWAAYSTLRVNYFLFASFITAYIVFLLSFAGLPEISVVTTRTEFTILGALVAMFAYTRFNFRSRKERTPHAAT